MNKPDGVSQEAWAYSHKRHGVWPETPRSNIGNGLWFTLIQTAEIYDAALAKGKMLGQAEQRLRDIHYLNTVEKRLAEDWLMTPDVVDLVATLAKNISEAGDEQACLSMTLAKGEERGRAEQLELESSLEAALNVRELFINPDILDYAANEVDCDGLSGNCPHTWHEWDTNAGGCHKEERGIGYCPNSLAETLRAVAKVARLAQAIRNGGNDE